jgi:hypothetical protein
MSPQDYMARRVTRRREATGPPKLGVWHGTPSSPQMGDLEPHLDPRGKEHGLPGIKQPE